MRLHGIKIHTHKPISTQFLLCVTKLIYARVNQLGGKTSNIL